MQTPLSYFTELTDPRVDRSKDHLMEDIIFITIAAVVCGAETWNDIENYGKAKESWLRQYLQLPNGIPPHDTFNRFFSALDPDEFEQAFLSWIKDISELTDGDVVSAIPKLLDVLVIKGCLVTIDAMGCQRDISAKIIDKGGNYLLAVKGNSKDRSYTLHQVKWKRRKRSAALYYQFQGECGDNWQRCSLTLGYREQFTLAIRCFFQ